MTFCIAWNAGRRVTEDAWEVNIRADTGRTWITCRLCSWRGPCGIVAQCGACGSHYVRLDARGEVAR